MSDPKLLAGSGPGSPPRRNGELVFEAPWESRAFGLAVSLHDQGLLHWEDFRRRLIAEIAAWEARHGPDAPYAYYVLWLAALEQTLAHDGAYAAEELEARVRELAARPHGHDHAAREA